MSGLSISRFRTVTLVASRATPTTVKPSRPRAVTVGVTSTQSDGPTAVGIGGTLNWLVGGAISGLVGSAAFGVLLWVIDPEYVAAGIPAIYGLDPAGAVGWGLHLLHGLVLGAVFGFLVTREPILGTLTADVATGFIAAMGPGLRISLAGLVYGLAIWMLLPMIALSVWATVGGTAEAAFPVAAAESLVGHLIYGLLLGALFSLFVETAPEAEETDAPFEEASESS